MTSPTFDPNKLFVGGVALYTSPANTPMVEDSLATGALWPDPWVSSGATQEGVQINSEPDLTRHRIDEQPTPAWVSVNARNFVLATVLVEDELETLKLALGSGTITTTAAGTGQIGKKTYIFSSDLTPLAVGFEGRNHYGFWRRAYVPRVASVGSLEVPHRRAESPRAYPVSLEAMCRFEDMSVVDMTAEATG